MLWNYIRLFSFQYVKKGWHYWEFSSFNNITAESKIKIVYFPLSISYRSHYHTTVSISKRSMRRMVIYLKSAKVAWLRNETESQWIYYIQWPKMFHCDNKFSDFSATKLWQFKGILSKEDIIGPLACNFSTSKTYVIILTLLRKKDIWWTRQNIISLLVVIGG